MRALARAGLALGALFAVSSLGAQQRAFHVINYDLTLDLPEAGKTIDGVAKLTVYKRGRGDTLALDLLDLKAKRVLIGGAPKPFRQDASHVLIPVTMGFGDTIVVTVEYGGAVTDGLVIGTDSAGRWMAFGDNWPNRARRWIPSIDHPSDKSTVTWTVRAPSDRKVVANGQLVEESRIPRAADPDGSAGRPVARTLTRWRETRPIPAYLMVIAAAPLVRYDLGATACGLAEIGRCVEQSVYVAPEQQRILPGEFRRAGDIVEFYSRLVGTFPYEKLAHLQSSTRYGGMENAGAIFYADGLFRRGGVGSSLIAHETAHQWFGDAVTEGEWGHVWLSEGFATYFAALYAGHAFGDSALTAEMSKTRAQLIKSAVVASRPVIDTTQTDLMALLNENSYQKGGWVLHMLRSTIGDSAFFGGIREYYAQFRHQNALTDDLRAAMENHIVPGGSAVGALKWFFDQWLTRPGVAQVTTSWTYDATTRRVTLEVEQGSRFAPYRFPLTVDVTDARGVVHRGVVEIPAQLHTRVVLPVIIADGPPRALLVDPAVQLLAELRAR